MQEGLIFTVETVVLIVAKCNVNTYTNQEIAEKLGVLIVAKCNVNRETTTRYRSINGY